MSDMLAVLLGAGGGKGAHAMTLLSAGKAEAKQALLPAGTSDPFMEVLSARLNPAAGGLADKAADANEVIDGKTLLTGQGGESADPAGARPLDVALFQAQAAPADASLQASLAASVVPASAPAPLAVGPLLQVDYSPSQPPDHGALASGKPLSAADSAATWQALPAREEATKLLAASLHADPSPSSMSAGGVSGGVAQSLAAQLRETPAEVGGIKVDPVASAPGQAAPPPPNAALGMAGEIGVRPAPAALQLSVEAPLRSPAFPQELGERVVWLSSRLGQVADIALNPPHLGPLEVKLSLAGGEAGAQFFSPHPQVREAIEAALPKLREMMAEAGVTLGQAHVRDEAFPRQEAFAQENTGRQGVGQGGRDEQAVVGLVPGGASRVGMGLVDLYV